MPIPVQKLKPWSLRPSVNDTDVAQWMDWAQTALNALIGQAVQQGQGLDFLFKSSVDPSTARVISLGSRAQSISTAIAYASTPTSITFYWDGTNGSTPFKLWRDDGSIVGPIIAGSSLAVTGLAASTLYFFYPYYDEVSGHIVFASVTGAVGSPPVAYTSATGLAVQQQIMRNHIPLAPGFGSTGITTPATGSSSGSGGAGGGGAGGRGIGALT